MTKVDTKYREGICFGKKQISELKTNIYFESWRRKWEKIDFVDFKINFFLNHEVLYIRKIFLFNLDNVGLGRGEGSEIGHVCLTFFKYGSLVTLMVILNMYIQHLCNSMKAVQIYDNIFKKN